MHKAAQVSHASFKSVGDCIVGSGNLLTLFTMLAHPPKLVVQTISPSEQSEINQTICNPG